MICLFLASVINIDILYISINLMLLFVFIIAGYNVSKGGSYWRNAYVCIVMFVLVFGSRYNRGHDYAHYVDAYLHGDEGHEYLFTAFNTFLREVLKLSKYLIFYIYSVPFIICGFKFLKNFKVLSRWLFPLFLISMTYFEEYEIRQAFGFSFVFLFLDEFINKRHSLKHKFLLCIVYCFLIIGIHSANILFVLIFLLTYFVIKRVIPYYLSISLLLFATYIFPNIYDISYLNPLFDILGTSGNTKFAQYTEGNAAEAWFGESALQLDNARNPVIQFFELLANSALFYFSCKSLKANDKTALFLIIALTNLYIIGHIGRQAFLYLEILNRMASMFQRMWFIPLAIVLAKQRFTKLNTFGRLSYLAMFFIFYEYIKYLIAPLPGYTKFLWDI